MRWWRRWKELERSERVNLRSSALIYVELRGVLKINWRWVTRGLQTSWISHQTRARQMSPSWQTRGSSQSAREVLQFSREGYDQIAHLKLLYSQMWHFKWRSWLKMKMKLKLKPVVPNATSRRVFGRFRFHHRSMLRRDYELRVGMKVFLTVPFHGSAIHKFLYIAHK